MNRVALSTLSSDDRKFFADLMTEVIGHRATAEGVEPTCFTPQPREAILTSGHSLAWRVHVVPAYTEEAAACAQREVNAYIEALQALGVLVPQSCQLYRRKKDPLTFVQVSCQKSERASGLLARVSRLRELSAVAKNRMESVIRAILMSCRSYLLRERPPVGLRMGIDQFSCDGQVLMACPPLNSSTDSFRHVVGLQPPRSEAERARLAGEYFSPTIGLFELFTSVLAYGLSMRVLFSNAASAVFGSDYMKRFAELSQATPYVYLNRGGEVSECEVRERISAIDECDTQTFRQFAVVLAPQDDTRFECIQAIYALTERSGWEYRPEAYRKDIAEATLLLAGWVPEFCARHARKIEQKKQQRQLAARY